jgi:deazaflavin-dependent oxidoreductase (nitroreductase family)
MALALTGVERQARDAKEVIPMRRSLLLIGLVGGGLVARHIWRTNPRLGTRWANETLNPLFVRYGGVAYAGKELGLLEHVGRRTGIVRQTPIHPVRTAEGFRIVVPLGPKSEWAHNVIAAGRCRLQVEDVVYELDEPTLVPAADMADLPGWIRWATSRMGFMYLRLHRFAERPGTLAGPEVTEARTPTEVQPLVVEPELVEAGATSS